MKKITISNPPVPNYTTRESINKICTNIIFSGKNLKKIMLTSCVAAEGKSTVCMELAQIMAERGKRCVLVDLDLRASAAAKRFRIHTDTDEEFLGISRYLTGQCRMEDIIYETNIDNLYYVPVDKNVSNPIALINSTELETLITYLGEEYDLVIVDTPPVGLISDAADIAGMCDGSIMLLEYGKRHRTEAQNALNALKNSGTRVLGCIIDKVTMTSLSEKRYYYSRYYHGSYYSHRYGSYGAYGAYGAYGENKARNNSEDSESEKKDSADSKSKKKSKKKKAEE